MANEETCLLCGRQLKPEDSTAVRFNHEGRDVEGHICLGCAPAGWQDGPTANSVIYRALSACSRGETPT